MDYNATTPLEPEVIQAVSEALQDAWGNPSSNYIAGQETSRSHLLYVFGSRNVKMKFCVSVNFRTLFGPFCLLSNQHCCIVKKTPNPALMVCLSPGAKAKAMINQSRENVARMVGGRAEDIIFTSGGTEVIKLSVAEEEGCQACNRASWHAALLSRPIIWFSTPPWSTSGEAAEPRSAATDTTTVPKVFLTSSPPTWNTTRSNS